MSINSPSAITFGDRTYALDPHGYLDPDEHWDENFAAGMAEKLGIYNGLTQEHLSFINYLRKKFVDEKAVPLVVAACIDNSLRLSRLRLLFPTGYHRGACKIAGINYEFMSNVNLLLTYENYTTLKSEYKLTGTGFLESFEQWNERFAMLIMREYFPTGTLTEQHRKIIGFLRNYFGERKTIPTVYETCKSNDVTLLEFGELFPGGYRRGACRVAGLPFFG